MHICCSGCAVFAIESLREEGFHVRGTFWNPNIHPYREYQARREALRQLAQHMGVELIGKDSYGAREFLREVVFREEKRCRICIGVRLMEGAKRAKAGAFDSFTTTLLASAHMDHAAVKDLGEAISDEVGVPFLYRDFRPGWRRSLEVTKTLGLYRQEYCGCIYSEEDRFGKQRVDC